MADKGVEQERGERWKCQINKRREKSGGIQRVARDGRSPLLFFSQTFVLLVFLFFSAWLERFYSGYKLRSNEMTLRNWIKEIWDSESLPFNDRIMFTWKRIITPLDYEVTSVSPWNSWAISDVRLCIIDKVIQFYSLKVAKSVVR